MKRFTKTLRASVAALALMAAPAFAADPLVDVAWLKENLGSENMVVLDARGSTDDLRGHVPGAVFSDYGKDGWRVAKDGVPGLFPDDPAKLGELIGSLGISDDDRVVIVAGGRSSSVMGTATLIYWTFKVLGHDEVSILDGGINASLAKLYEASGVPVEGAQINFCNTGHWASIRWVVSSELLGNDSAVLYDPSMTGWTAKGMPDETKISAN